MRVGKIKRRYSMGVWCSTKRILTEEDIKQLTETYTKFEEGLLEDEKGFCKTSTHEEIQKHGYILTPGWYVGFKPEEDDGISFEEKMKTLTSELDDLFKESDHLEVQIRNNLKAIGFPIGK